MQNTQKLLFLSNLGFGASSAGARLGYPHFAAGAPLLAKLARLPRLRLGKE